MRRQNQSVPGKMILLAFTLIGSLTNAHALDGIELPTVKSGLSTLIKPVYAGLSVHVEGGSECPLLLNNGGAVPGPSDCDAAKYSVHLRNLQDFAAIFVGTSGNLPLSLEFEEQFLNAAKAFKEETAGGARLSALASQGHTLSAHADSYAYSGESRGTASASAVQAHFAHLKATLESPDVQTAQPKVALISGVCASTDWLKSIQELGFTGVSGLVSYCLKSLPSGAYPSEDIPVAGSTIEAACPNPSVCHATYPYAYYSSTDGKYSLREATLPWRTDSSLKFRGGNKAIQKTNWQASTSAGTVAVLSGVGQIYCLAEKKSATSRTASETHCNFCRDDIDAYFEMLDQVLSERVPLETRAFTSVYSLGTSSSQRVGTGCTDGTPPGTLRSELLADFVRRMSRYVADGKVSWKALPKMIPLVR